VKMVSPVSLASRVLERQDFPVIQGIQVSQDGVDSLVNPVGLDSPDHKEI